MNSIHYFQRYSKKEDVVTNNTLLLFSRLYHKSPYKFSVFIKALLDEIDLEVGVKFHQQVRAANSVPDGVIQQESMKIAIETKLDKNFLVNQLVNHLQSFQKETNKILLALSPEGMKKTQFKKVSDLIRNYNEQNSTRIKFVSLTFKEVVEKYKGEIDDFDIELSQLISDYEDFCMNEGLIPMYGDRMLAVGCSWTLPENLASGIYYDPVDRGYTYCTHLGLYSDKCIRGVGKIVNVVAARLDSRQNLEVLSSTAEVCTEQQKAGIKKAILEATAKYGWDISEGHKFFCVEKFHETSFEKTSKWGMIGRKYFDLNALLEKSSFDGTQEIADLLRKRQW